MLVEERSLTSGMLLEETNSPEIGICLSTPLRTRRLRKELYSSAKLGMFSESRPMRDRPIVCWRVKPVGEPCAGNPHARFDERECGNGAWHAAIEARTGKPRHGTMPKPKPPRHLSTLPNRLPRSSTSCGTAPKDLTASACDTGCERANNGL